MMKLWKKKQLGEPLVILEEMMGWKRKQRIVAILDETFAALPQQRLMPE